MTERCIGIAIWELATAIQPELRTAQQRHALDIVLRRELAKIKDAGLRDHAAEIIRHQRRLHFERSDQPGLDARISRIERILGIAESEAA